MNYLAHARCGLNDPYWVAGTSLPDWMNVVDRKNRARRVRAAAVVDHPDPRIASLARGCLQHHQDDAWFHQTETFVQLSAALAVALRDMLPPGSGHQAGFVGHVALELLLDSVLMERDPHLLDRYYRALADLDLDALVEGACRICLRPAPGLRELVPRFIEVRFLADYRDDFRLLYRLNGVMRRVGLPPLPDRVCEWLAQARGRVRQAADQLLTPTTP
ncbi:MAG: hypothetical protein D6753_18155 [Planctomycetota bacterium]|nr:MAG: hypothetical protein D6753_18155 [Planctomycetota bacterium]